MPLGNLKPPARAGLWHGPWVVQMLRLNMHHTKYGPAFSVLQVADCLICKIILQGRR